MQKTKLPTELNTREIQGLIQSQNITIPSVPMSLPDCTLNFAAFFGLPFLTFSITSDALLPHSLLPLL